MKWFLSIVFVLSLSFCSGEKGYRPLPRDQEAADADASIHGFSLNGREKNNEWLIRANSALVFESGKKIEMQSPRIQILSNETLIVSERGIWEEDEKQAYLLGRVHITAKNKRTLETEELTYNGSTGRITSHKPVKIRYPEGDTITAAGLEADTSLQNITFFQGKGYHPDGTP